MNVNKNNLLSASPISAVGRVTNVLGPVIRGKMLGASVGDEVLIKGRVPVCAHVLGFSEEGVVMIPLGSTAGITLGSEIELSDSQNVRLISGRHLGKVLDGNFNILSDLSPRDLLYESLDTGVLEWPPRPPKIEERSPLVEQFFTGINSIDFFTPFALGQRILVLSKPGAGKTSLLTSIAQHGSADINVLALIGERGREASEYIAGPALKSIASKTLLIVSTSDEPALMRVQAAMLAFAAASYFRARGCQVLLQIDSLTRLVRALRDIGLSSGELPVRKGYPPSVFSLLPQLLECPGRTSQGSVTAIFSMLLTDDFDEDPMVSEVVSITDGHIYLSEEAARRGDYPAINFFTSLSRLQRSIQCRQKQIITRDILTLLKRADEARKNLMFGENRNNRIFFFEGLSRSILRDSISLEDCFLLLEKVALKAREEKII